MLCETLQRLQLPHHPGANESRTRIQMLPERLSCNTNQSGAAQLVAWGRSWKWMGAFRGVSQRVNGRTTIKEPGEGRKRTHHTFSHTARKRALAHDGLPQRPSTSIPVHSESAITFSCLSASRSGTDICIVSSQYWRCVGHFSSSPARTHCTAPSLSFSLSVCLSLSVSLLSLSSYPLSLSLSLSLSQCVCMQVL